MEYFKKISMTGRICYLFMCIEKYLVSMYPDKDWTPIADRLWTWTERYWNEARDITDQVIPEYIFEFDSYEETNQRCFDGELSEELYNTLVNLYDGITNGDTDDEINQVLLTTVEWGNVTEGSGFSDADVPTLNYLDWMISVLEKHNIELPDKTAVAAMTKDQKYGWGDFCDCRYLSIILKNDIKK